MSEEKQPDPKFSSELTYLQMLKNFHDAAQPVGERMESFGANVWFPDLALSFPNFGSCDFSRKEAKKDSWAVTDDVGQLYARGEYLDYRINIDDSNIFTELPKAICTYALALEGFATERELRPGILAFNIGILWSDSDQYNTIEDKLQQEISFPVHP